MKECENHFGCGYYIDQDDKDAVDQAYAIASNRFNNQHATMKDFRSLEEVRTILHDAFEEHRMDECPGCYARDND